ncbi:hypothetical protein RhiirC2_792641, partial [Rhizophagus irregularis]
MGVNVSTEDFATLEGFVNKSNDERAEILRNAGWEPEAETHVANMEIGKTDRAEYEHLQPYNNPPIGILIETEEEIWNNFVKDEETTSKSEGKKRCHVTSDGYDKKDNDAMVGVQTSNPTESIHAYNFSNTRQRYHAKISTSICKISKEEIEQELQKIFNKERFQMEVLFKNGNQYLYVIFTSAQERLRLTNCIKIQQSVGKFYADSERDCTHKSPIELCVDYIPAQATELDIKNVLEGELGYMREITFWPIRGNNQFKKAKIMLEVTCSDKHLIETWSLPMGDNNRIKITPTKLSHEDRNTRIRYGAKVM